MKRLPTIMVALLAAASLAVSCASEAGQLAAEEVFPSVKIVTEDLEQYLDAGIRPDGTPLTPEEELARRGNVVVLRNAFHVAMGQPREPLPRLEGTPSGERSSDR